MWLGVIDQPLTILHTNLAVYIGIVYAYLPFYGAANLYGADAY